MLTLSVAKRVFRETLLQWGEGWDLVEAWHGADAQLDFVGEEFQGKDVLVSFSIERLETHICVQFYKGASNPPAALHARMAFLFEQPQVYLEDLIDAGRCSKRHKRLWWSRRIRSEAEMRNLLRRRLEAVDDCASEILRGNLDGVVWRVPPPRSSL